MDSTARVSAVISGLLIPVHSGLAWATGTGAWWESVAHGVGGLLIVVSVAVVVVGRFLSGC